MGGPIAGHLKARGGHEVVVYNRSAEKAEAWVARHGGQRATTPAEAARGAEFVFACVGNDADARAVAAGPDGAFAAMAEGAVYIDHTTTSAHLARELHTAAEARGIHYLDAPVSGGQIGAENGVLTVMVGGDPDAFTRAEPVIAAHARKIGHMGPAGAGQLTKMVNQICNIGIAQGLAEGIHFAERAGLDIARVIEVIAKGAAQSWQMENRWQTMAEGQFDFGFAVDWMRKDLGFCLEEARLNGARLPMTALVDQFYADIQAIGGGRWDGSSLIARLQKGG
jgi:3-hydroxyisobutyrate dehydrogenase-like beta-hydroxyacid dehydrogenase